MMIRRPILVEIIGGGRGIALGSGGRFYHVRVPAGVSLGEELPGQGVQGWYKLAIVAAVAGLFFLCSPAVVFPRRSVEAYSLVNLRFAKHAVSGSARVSVIASPGLLSAQGKSDIQVTLAIDRKGTVAAVRPRQPSTKNLVGMRVEQAIQHTVGQLTEISDGDVEVRPFPSSSEDETEALTKRIRTALPDHEPPIGLAVGPPAADEEVNLVQEGESSEDTGKDQKLTGAKKSIFRFWLKKKSQLKDGSFK